MKYPIKAALVALVCVGLGYALKPWVPEGWFPVHLPFIGVFFFLSSAAMHALVGTASKDNPRRFPTYFMGITGLKMFLYLVVIGLYALLLRDLAIPFTLAFMFFYLAFTTLEVISFLAQAKG